MLGPLRRADRDSASVASRIPERPGWADKLHSALPGPCGEQTGIVLACEQNPSPLSLSAPSKTPKNVRPPSFFPGGSVKKAQKRQGNPIPMRWRCQNRPKMLHPQGKKLGGVAKKPENASAPLNAKNRDFHRGLFLWAQTDLNRRPPACKAGALNQLSYAPFSGPQR